MTDKATPAKVRLTDGLVVADIQAAMKRLAHAHLMLGNCNDRDPADEALCQAIRAYRRAAVAAERERWTEAVMAELDGNGQAHAIVAYATRA